MKVLKRLLIAVVAIVALVVVIGLLLPRTRHLERSIEIDAPASVVFAQINGFRHFNDWSPFVAVMPKASYAFEGPEFGVGSKISWVLATMVWLPFSASGSATSQLIFEPTP